MAPGSFRTTRRVAALAGVLAWLATAVVPAGAQHPPVVEGRVTDRLSGAPVVGARVVAVGAGIRSTTGADGAFALRALVPGPRTLHIDAPGYVSENLQVHARNGETFAVRIELDPDPLAVQGVEAAADERRVLSQLVLERGDLDARGATDLATAIETLPGLVVTRRGGPGSPATVSIRGGSADQVLVLLDGVPLGTPLAGAVDLSTISLDGVERVTILPGAQSARYGPRALSGVILIEGRRSGAGETRASASAGTWGSAGFSGGVGGMREQPAGPRIAGRLGGEWRTTNGAFPYPVPAVRGGGTATRINADARTLTLGGGGTLTSGNVEVRVLADVMDLDRGMPGPVVAPTATARQQQRRVTVTAGTAIDGPVRWDGSVDGQRQTARFSDPTPPASAPFAEETVARSLGARVAARTTLPGVDLEVGSEGRIVDVYSTSLSASAPANQSGLGLWTAATAHRDLSATWSGTLTGALRVDGHTLVGTPEWSPRIAASVSGGRWTLRASVGNGFSPPSLSDQFFQEGVLVKPNPDLGPERVRGELAAGADLRVFTSRSATLRASVDLYRSNVDGMILWFPDHRFVWSPDNFDVQRRGWDASMEFTVLPAGTRLRAALARTTVEYGGPVLEGQVVYRPEWTGSGSLSSTWAPVSTEIATRFVGSRRTVPGSEANALDRHWLTDVHVGISGSVAGWDLGVRVSTLNVLDVDAAMLPDYPLPGRAYGVELTLRPSS